MLTGRLSLTSTRGSNFKFLVIFTNHKRQSFIFDKKLMTEKSRGPTGMARFGLILRQRPVGEMRQWVVNFV